MSGRSVPNDYFEAMYRGDPDPWGYKTRTYEHGKYAATLSALPRARYKAAFEVGCSIGVLTRLLATRCDTVMAADCSETSLALARETCRDTRNVRLVFLRVPVRWPGKSFDLILLSEVLYYLSGREVARTARRTIESLRPNGTVVLVHWLGSTGAAQTGDQAATRFLRETRGFLRPVRRKRNAHYRLDILVRRSLPYPASF